MRWQRVLQWLLGQRWRWLRLAMLSIVCSVSLCGCIRVGGEKKSAATSSLAKTVDPAARAQLKHLYATAADAVQYDGTLDAPVLRSTLDVARYVQRLNQYRWSGPSKLASDEFAAELDRRWVAAVGNQDKELTPDLRLVVAGVLRGIADEL